MDFKNINFPPVLFVTGIGTDVGKSYATGWLALMMNESGKKTMTQKLIQTGNKDFSEDIECHRKIMNIPVQPEDQCHLTAPEIFSYPCSPHLAAQIDERKIDFDKIESATKSLLSKHQHLLIEGAGGLMVPLTEDYLTIDYISDHNYPVILVVGGQLGSINHILLSLLAIRSYGLDLFAVVYNPFFDKDEIICSDTRRYIQKFLQHESPKTLFIEMPNL